MSRRNDFINDFAMYSKIQDPLLWLGSSDNPVLLSASLNLYNQSLKTHQVEYYYREFQYVSEKLNQETRKIKRDYDAYLQLENVRPIGTYREFIPMKGKDIEFCRYNLIPKFEEVIRDFDKIYQVRENKVYVQETTPFMVDLGSKYLVFKPGLMSSFTEDIKPCIDMFMNGNDNNCVHINFDQLYGFMYIIRTFDLYNYAANMLSYLGRPPATTNIIDRTTGQEANQMNRVDMTVDPRKRRVVGEEKKKSYFNKED